MGVNLIKKIDLENGLHLDVCDVSKKVAGDRWLVKLAAKIEIPVKDYFKDRPPDMNADDVMKVLGEKVVFEKTMERNFIDDKEKETVLNGFCDSFLESTLTYLSAPNFPKQFILKKYKEIKTHEKWAGKQYK